MTTKRTGHRRTRVAIRLLAPVRLISGNSSPTEGRDAPKNADARRPIAAARRRSDDITAP
jgi:hypothetical protein